MECGRGKNRIQASLNLKQEDEYNCTLVVFGFHRVIKDWWKDVVKGRQRLGEHTGGIARNSTNSIYTSADKPDRSQILYDAQSSMGEFNEKAIDIIKQKIEDEDVWTTLGYTKEEMWETIHNITR